MTDFSYGTVDTSLPVTPAMRAFQDAVRLGFGLSAGPDAAYEHWARDVLADGTRLDVARATAPAGLPELDLPVATFGSLVKTVNVGGGRLEPALYIVDVTVRTTHRRRGVLRRLMTDALTRAKADGLALAVLTASEGGIYGRYGFGVAVEHRSVSLETGLRLGWTREAEPRIALVDPAAAEPIREQVFARFHAARRGSHDRPHQYATMLTGTWDYDADAERSDLRVAVHWDEDGVPDGVLTYAINEPEGSARVWDLVAATPRAELALWQYLGSIDLVTTVTWRHANPSSPLPWALTDPRVLTITAVEDYIWLRLLDVPAALAARGWDADGAAALEVIDPLGLAGGTFALTVRDGRAQVTSAEAAPVRIGVDALASLYFGLADARALAAAGRITGPDADVAALNRLFATDEPPYNLAAF